MLPLPPVHIKEIIHGTVLNIVEMCEGGGLSVFQELGFLNRLFQANFLI